MTYLLSISLEELGYISREILNISDLLVYGDRQTYATLPVRFVQLY